MKWARRAAATVAVVAAMTVATVGPALALPPPGPDVPGTQDDGAGGPPSRPRPAPTPAPGPHGGPGIPDDPRGGTNAPPDAYPDAPTPTIRRVAAGVHLQNRSVSTLVTVPPGIAIDGGRPFEISVAFGGTRVTQNYDPVHGNRLTHDFSAGDGSLRTEQVDITLRETLADGGFQPYAIRSKLPVEPLYDIKVDALYFHEIGHCDVGTPADPVIGWRDPGGGKHQKQLDPGFFDDFDVLYAFGSTWTEVGAARGLTVPGIDWYDSDSGVPSEFKATTPQAGPPLLPGATRKVQQIIPVSADDGGPCEGEFTYFLTYTPRTYTL
jgi:hypothetical protein